MLAASQCRSVVFNAVIEKKWRRSWPTCCCNVTDALAQRKLNIEGGLCWRGRSHRGEARLPEGGELDLEKVASLLLTDYRSGALGGSAWKPRRHGVAMIEAAAAAAEQDPDRAGSGCSDVG